VATVCLTKDLQFIGNCSTAALVKANIFFYKHHLVKETIKKYSFGGNKIEYI